MATMSEAFYWGERAWYAAETVQQEPIILGDDGYILIGE
jgi:hypothetical protein